MQFAEADEGIVQRKGIVAPRAPAYVPPRVDARLTVAVALCSYNGEAYLEEQLESLAAQTRLPDEVIIGDDHSTDLTLKVIERFRGEHPFLCECSRGT